MWRGIAPLHRGKDGFCPERGSARGPRKKTSRKENSSPAEEVDRQFSTLPARTHSRSAPPLATDGGRARVDGHDRVGRKWTISAANMRGRRPGHSSARRFPRSAPPAPWGPRSWPPACQEFDPPTIACARSRQPWRAQGMQGTGVSCRQVVGAPAIRPSGPIGPRRVPAGQTDQLHRAGIDYRRPPRIIQMIATPSACSVRVRQRGCRVCEQRSVSVTRGSFSGGAAG